MDSEIKLLPCAMDQTHHSHNTVCCVALCCAVLGGGWSVQDNFPTLNTIANDLSPFYLAKARENINYWKSQQAPGANLGGADGTGETWNRGTMQLTLSPTQPPRRTRLWHGAKGVLCAERLACLWVAVLASTCLMHVFSLKCVRVWVWVWVFVLLLLRHQVHSVPHGEPAPG